MKKKPAMQLQEGEVPKRKVQVHKERRRSSSQGSQQHGSQFDEDEYQQEVEPEEFEEDETDPGYKYRGRSFKGQPKHVVMKKGQKKVIYGDQVRTALVEYKTEGYKQCLLILQLLLKMKDMVHMPYLSMGLKSVESQLIQRQLTSP